MAHRRRGLHAKSMSYSSWRLDLATMFLGFLRGTGHQSFDGSRQSRPVSDRRAIRVVFRRPGRLGTDDLCESRSAQPGRPNLVFPRGLGRNAYGERPFRNVVHPIWRDPPVCGRLAWHSLQPAPARQLGTSPGKLRSVGRDARPACLHPRAVALADRRRDLAHERNCRLAGWSAWLGSGRSQRIDLRSGGVSPHHRVVSARPKVGGGSGGGDRPLWGHRVGTSSDSAGCFVGRACRGRSRWRSHRNVSRHATGTAVNSVCLLRRRNPCCSRFGRQRFAPVDPFPRISTAPGSGR
jgi:hypothetical protein